jgi:hypothetical protein
MLPALRSPTAQSPRTGGTRQKLQSMQPDRRRRDLPQAAAPSPPHRRHRSTPRQQARSRSCATATRATRRTPASTRGDRATSQRPAHCTIPSTSTSSSRARRRATGTTRTPDAAPPRPASQAGSPGLEALTPTPMPTLPPGSQAAGSGSTPQGVPRPRRPSLASRLRLRLRLPPHPTPSTGPGARALGMASRWGRQVGQPGAGGCPWAAQPRAARA